MTRQQSLLRARQASVLLSALSFHLQQLVKFITGIKQLTLMFREMRRLAPRLAGMLNCLTLAGSSHWILCSPRTLPPKEGDPSATPSLQGPVAFPALGGTLLEGGCVQREHQEEALTHPVPTALFVVERAGRPGPCTS